MSDNPASVPPVSPDGVTPKENPNKASLPDSRVDLYKLLVDQFHRYCTILWQFPAAILAANSFAIDKFLGKPVLLLALGFIDAALVYAFYRLVVHQRSITAALKKSEADLRENVSATFIPEFEATPLKATTVTLFILSILTLGLIAYSGFEVLRAYCSCICDR